MAHNVMLINRKDNVGVALFDIGKGEKILLSTGAELDAVQDIPYSHKVALREIRTGEPVFKYGEIIGHARSDIGPGAWVHTHNLQTLEL